jgi:hypothetical protein
MNIKEFQALHVDTNGTALLWLLYILQSQFVAFYFISHNLNIRGPLLLLVTTCISSPFFELKRRSRQIIVSSQVSEWLLFNANSAVFQLYHDENKLIFNEMMSSALNENNAISLDF